MATLVDPPRAVTGREAETVAGDMEALVSVWDAVTFELLHRLRGHTRSVTAACTTRGSAVVFTCSRDSIRAWDARSNFANIWALTLPSVCGAALSLAGVTDSYLFIGTQSTNVLASLWPLQPSAAKAAEPESSSGKRKRRRSHSGSQKAGAQRSKLTVSTSDAATPAVDGDEHEWEAHSGHRGYVYSVVSVAAGSSTLLFTGSGDGEVWAWRVGRPKCASPSSPSSKRGRRRSRSGDFGSDDGSAAEARIMRPIGKMTGHKGPVFSLAAEGAEVFSGGADGSIRVWDLETRACVRVLSGHSADVTCLCAASEVHGPGSSAVFFSGSSDKTVRMWERGSYTCIGIISHDCSVLGVGVIGSMLHTLCLNRLDIWDFSEVLRSHELVAPAASARVVRGGTAAGVAPTPPLSPRSSPDALTLTDSSLVSLLRQCISIPSVSGDPAFNNDCWRAAKFFRSVLQAAGADCKLAHSTPGAPPVVLGRMGWDESLPTLLVYGHYDVQPAGALEHWRSDPFTLTGRDGFLYARGTTDNKGPVLASIVAAAAFHRRRVVDTDSGAAAAAGGAGGHTPRKGGDLPNMNFVFAIEGTGESGSEGFVETIEEQKDWFSGLSLLVNSNNTWLGNDVPCVTYGLRGCVVFSVSVTGASHGLHGGVDGGASVEAMADLIAILAQLVDPTSGDVLVPGLMESARTITDSEAELYRNLHFDVDEYTRERGINRVYERDGVEHLKRRWNKPALSVHSIHGSEDNPSVLPHRCTATVSVRIVPDQKNDEVERLVTQHLRKVFEARASGNTLDVTVVSSAPYWLTDPFSAPYQAAARAIKARWNMEPMFVREGGTQKLTTLLTDALGVPAIHLPLGQSSDGPHLANERIRLLNLLRGRDVLDSFFEELSGVLTAERPAGAK